MHNLNWENLHYVLMVSRTGSIAAAARKLGVNRTTVLRRVKRFELELGFKVFTRIGNNYALSPEAHQLLDISERLELAVNDLERQFIGAEPGLSGEIRITTTDSVYIAMIGPALAEFQCQHPLIKIELTITNYHLNLAQRDSDVAIRPTITPPEDLASYRIGDVEFGVYASPAYLLAASAGDLSTCRWLGLSEPLLSAPVGHWFQDNVSPDAVIMSSDSFMALKTAAEQGLGVTVLPSALAAPSQGLQRLEYDLGEITTDLWLIIHPDLAGAGRIRALIEHLLGKWDGLSESSGQGRKELRKTDSSGECHPVFQTVEN